MSARATDREVVDRGTRLTFRRNVDLAALTDLVTAEQDCCRFLTFTLTISSDLVALDITGPAEARPVIDALIGTAS